MAEDNHCLEKLVVRGGLEPLTRTNFSMKLSIYVKCKS
jgi:hypothetical protein